METDGNCAYILQSLSMQLSQDTARGVHRQSPPGNVVEQPSSRGNQRRVWRFVRCHATTCHTKAVGFVCACAAWRVCSSPSSISLRPWQPAWVLWTACRSGLGRRSLSLARSTNQIVSCCLLVQSVEAFVVH